LYIKVETVQQLQKNLPQEAVVEAVLEHLVRDPMRFPMWEPWQFLVVEREETGNI
jgi:hypothetical protein